MSGFFIRKKDYQRMPWDQALRLLLLTWAQMRRERDPTAHKREIENLHQVVCLGQTAALLKMVEHVPEHLALARSFILGAIQL
jgi:hypothetical protein